jgi:hypothetical protein
MLLAGGITLPISAAIALEPAHHDGATFVYMGEMWARGVLPYVQIFDNKPPGIFAVSALAAHTPSTIWAIAVIQFIFVMGCIYTVRSLLQIGGASPRAVLLGTLAMALMANLQAYAPGNMAESYMLWPMAASMLFFFRALRSGNLRDVFLAGLLSGVACMFKPFGLSAMIAQMAFVLTSMGHLNADDPVFSHDNRMTWTMANGFGAITAWIPAIAYFAVHHGLRQMFNASFFYNAHYGAAAKPLALVTLSMVATRLLPVASTVVCLSLGWQRDRSETWMLTQLWFGVGLGLVLMAGRGYGHYFMSLTPALALAAGLFFWHVEESAPEMRRTIGALILAPIFLAYVPGFVDVRDVMRHRDTPVDETARELKLIAKPSDTLLVWGYEPWLFSSTHLRSALRYPTTQYMYDSPYQYPRVGKEILTGMQTSPPDWVVVAPGEYTPAWLTQPDRMESAFMSNLHAHYALAWQQDGFTIYKRTTLRGSLPELASRVAHH